MKKNFIYLLLGLFSLPAVGHAADLHLSIYAGRMTSETWVDTISTDVDYVDAGLAVVAGAWTISRHQEGALSFELEAQVGKYFGDQVNWEFNLPIAAVRWQRFPWQERVATSFAWGIGPSYATEVPEVESEVSHSSQRWLVYWFAELTFGPPKSNWALLLRLHHRSGAFGLVADEGGSNTVAAGVKFSFPGDSTK